MEPAHHTDPLEEALSHGSQRVAQGASLTAAMAQVVMQHKALDDTRRAPQDGHHSDQVLRDQQRLLHQQARLGWAPAHDRHWLTHADLPGTARTWAAAAAYADADPTAAAALRQCESRLRTLHPYAMARYDRLRDDGISPLDAMQQAAPLFARAPTARTGDPPPGRHTLAAGTGQELVPPADEVVSSMEDPAPGADTDPPAEARGRQIVARLQSRARAAGRPDLGADELAMILDSATNLPHHIIERLTQQPTTPAGLRNEENQSAAQLASQSFPFSAEGAIRAARAHGAKQTTNTATRVRTRHATDPPTLHRDLPQGGPQ
jgi:hypothetical protein